MERKERTKEEVCNKGSWFCKFFHPILLRWSSSKAILFDRGTRLKFELQSRANVFATVLLLLMMHFKYFWHGKLKKEMPFVYLSASVCVCCGMWAHARLSAISHLKTVIKVKKIQFSRLIFTRISGFRSRLSRFWLALCVATTFDMIYLPKKNDEQMRRQANARTHTQTPSSPDKHRHNISNNAHRNTIAFHSIPPLFLFHFSRSNISRNIFPMVLLLANISSIRIRQSYR